MATPCLMTRSISLGIDVSCCNDADAIEDGSGNVLADEQENGQEKEEYTTCAIFLTPTVSRGISPSDFGARRLVRSRSMNEVFPKISDAPRGARKSEILTP